MHTYPRVIVIYAFSLFSLVKRLVDAETFVEEGMTCLLHFVPFTKNNNVSICLSDLVEDNMFIISLCVLPTSCLLLLLHGRTVSSSTLEAQKKGTTTTTKCLPLLFLSLQSSFRCHPLSSFLLYCATPGSSSNIRIMESKSAKMSTLPAWTTDFF